LLKMNNNNLPKVNSAKLPGTANQCTSISQDKILVHKN
jgi:hypothetical protein